jgi:predicted glycosyltransferase
LLFRVKARLWHIAPRKHLNGKPSTRGFDQAGQSFFRPRVTATIGRQRENTMRKRRTRYRQGHARVLMYSHDTMGLGHLRRCREIAHSLVEDASQLSVLILSGSPIIGSFDFRARVDFVRVPGVIKLRNGDYTSLNLHLDIEETLKLRESIIRHTADTFDPDLFIVDKEPWGLRGEVRQTMEMLKERDTPLVLGLRDVMDEPAALVPEWERKKVLPALEDLYDEVWVYGMKQICDPFEGLDMPSSVRMKTRYTGYLRRRVPSVATAPYLPLTEDPFILVTAGGGGDGEALMDWVLRAYEHDADLPYPALLVLGPFMSQENQADFMERASQLDRVHVITFDSRIESLMARAAGMVSMGGYNTFCEILSFDKRALIVPRTEPRLEQYIRAQRAEELGMISMLVDDGYRDPGQMAAALRRLPSQPKPSEQLSPEILGGLDEVNKLAWRWLERTRAGGGERASRRA